MADIAVNADGTLCVGRARVQIPDYFLESELGRGASGVVFVAHHHHSKKLAVVKVWVALRAGDRRDKFRQGFEEAKKAARASELAVKSDALSYKYGHRNPDFLRTGKPLNWRSPENSIRAVRIHRYGETSGFVYAVMDYCPGVTLRYWLNETSPPPKELRHYEIPPDYEQYKKLYWYSVGMRLGKGPPTLGMRWNVAMQLLQSVAGLALRNLTHGDLHAKNILVVPNVAYLRSPEWPPNFQIVDFGTSIFARSRGKSIKRHWQVLDETMSELVTPFDVNSWCEDLGNSLHGRSAEVRIGRLDTFLTRVYAAICELGFPERGYGYFGLQPELRKKLDELVDSGRLDVSERSIGGFLDWYPFDR